MGETGGAGRRAWLEVDVAALRRNAERLARRVAPARLLPMVKADGYGLGAVRVAEALAPLAPYGFGVATVEEGAELRAAGVEGRVVVFSPCAPLDAGACLRHRLEPAVADLPALETYAAAAGETGRTLPVHLEVDTGMGRLGLAAGEALAWSGRVAEAVRSGRVEMASVFTHFHSAESDAAATREQWARFGAAVRALEDAGVDPGLRHAANSAACLRHPEVRADVVRPGIFLYGVGVPEVAGDRPEPVAHLRARVLAVRGVPAGTTVSYGATYATAAPARLATLGIGYGDGLPHALSNRGEALLAGRRVRVVGRVCMDVTVVDATGLDGVEPGTPATLLGADGEREIGLEAMAERCGTIAYELLTGLGRRLPRVDVRRPASATVVPA